MKHGVFALALVACIGLGSAPPAAAKEDDAVIAALVRAGCLQAADPPPGTLKLRTAIRCFQKAVNDTPSGTLSTAQRRALLEGQTGPAPQEAQAQGGWLFTGKSVRYSGQGGRDGLSFSCPEGRFAVSIANRGARAGQMVRVSATGGEMRAARIDAGHSSRDRLLTASFPGGYDVTLDFVQQSTRTAPSLNVDAPGTRITAATNGLPEALQQLRAHCQRDADPARLARQAAGDARLVEMASAAQPGGLPSLTGFDDLPADPDRQAAWDAYGFEFRAASGPPANGKPFVASIRPDSAAYRAGLRAGDVIEADSILGFVGAGGAARLHDLMARMAEPPEPGTERRVWAVDIYRPSTKTTGRIEIPPPTGAAQATPAAADEGDIPPLPPTLRQIALDRSMVALWRHEVQAIDTPDLGEAAMRILYALSLHVKACHGPDPVVIPVKIIREEVTRNGLALETGRDTTTFRQDLTVRREFAALARANLRYYSDSVYSQRFVAVRDLISQEGCDSPRLRRLEDGLAKAAGVRLTRTAAAPDGGQGTSGGLGADWRGFVSACTEASVPHVINNRLNAARVCNIVEGVLAEMGAEAAYAAYEADGLGALYVWPDAADKTRFDTRVSDVFRNPDDPLSQRGEAYVRDAGF